MEISFFMNPRNGRNNYYGTTFLYMVGEVVPWEEGKIVTPIKCRNIHGWEVKPQFIKMDR